MARVFLDANFVIETVGLRKSNAESRSLDGHDIFISPLTIHILCYAFKIDIPDKRIDNLIDQMHLVDINKKLMEFALLGPTMDFEDNIQLHSASLANADYFITHDQDLLKLAIFGKTKIVDSLDS